jgi:hypothetical protein
LFSELCRTFRGIAEEPIFTLFLSTAGNFHLLSPGSKEDLSGRVFDNLLPQLGPITEISFDDLAKPVEENRVSLDDVVTLDWISHLGRSLYVHFTYFHEQPISHPEQVWWLS